ncbi:MAG: sulfatase-like hydrolase/transferase [Verrucomicrobiota bacterium]
MTKPFPLIFSSIFLGTSLHADVLFDFTSSNVRPDNNPYTIEVKSLDGNPPSVATADTSGDLPTLTGSFSLGDAGDGSFTITLDGRNNDTSNWDADTWTGGNPHPVRGNNTGLGISDAAGNASVDGGEAILWSFDLTSLNLDPGESLVMTALNLNTSNAQFWQLTGTPGNAGAGTLVATGNLWNGNIQISHGDAFALTGTGRFREVTLEIINTGPADTPTNLTASAAVDSVQLDWDDDTSGNLDFFTIYRSTTSPVTTASDVLSTVTSSDFIDTTAEIGTSYFYAVSATSGFGAETNLSNESSAAALPPSPLQHLDATITGSVNGNPVTAWADQSGNNNDASAATGTVNYPSSSQSASGLSGLDFGPARSSLELFDANASDTWLDQSSNADGFSVMLAFKCDDLVPGQFNDLLGNSTDSTTGFQLGYTSAGQIQASLGGQVISTAGNSVAPGDTIVIAFQYDADSETYELWETVNFQSVTGPLAKTDFSTANPVTLGSIDNLLQFLHGIVGEVKVFDTALSPELFKEEREKLLHRWISPPNVIVILTDDMAWYDTPVRMDDRMLNSAQEIMRRLQDPANPGQPYYWHMQQLADQGMLFRNAYSGAPQCTPTRANLQTGQTTARNRVGVFLGSSGRGVEFDERSEFDNFPLTPNGIILPFPETMVTIPEALSPMGYQCAHYGKWHLGSDPAVEGYIESDGSTDNSEGETYPSSDQQIPADIADPKRINEMTDKAIAFMTSQQNGGKPFYIQLSHYAVHNPWECYPSSRALFQNDVDVLAFNNGETDVTELNRKRDPAAFFGMLYDLDQSIGRLMQEIDNLGITDKTYIVFKSDNGYRRFNTQNFSQPYYGAKWFLWQGGLRVPMIVKGPGIPSGQVSTANVATYDLLPTFFDWAGGTPANLNGIDGLSLKNHLEGDPPTTDLLDRSLYFHYPHYRSSHPFSAIVKGNYKLIHTYDGTTRTDISVSNPNLLFDLASDPGEVHNINTTPNDNPTAAALWSELDAYLDSVNAWRPRDNSANYLNDSGADYENSSDYDDRLRYSPFEGSRGAGTSPIDYWFESWGVDIGGDLDDYDLDGVANILEYALGRNPIFAEGPVSLPTLEFSGGAWRYTFPVRYAPGELTYTVSTSTDLDEWITLTNPSLTLTQTGSDFDWTQATLPTEERCFVRLDVRR